MVEEKSYNINLECESEGVDYIELVAFVSEYVQLEDKSESVEYTLCSIQVERNDNSVVELDQDELDLILEQDDKNTLEEAILEACRWDR